MELIYDEGKSYSCYPVQKDIDIINEKIDKLKDMYEDSESIKIDCDSFFIQFYFVFIISSLFLFF